MNNIYWQIKHIHEAQDIEEAAELLNSGWVIIQRLKHKGRPDSFICGTDRDVDRVGQTEGKQAQSSLPTQGQEVEKTQP